MTKLFRRITVARKPFYFSFSPVDTHRAEIRMHTALEDLAATVWRFEDVQDHTGSICRRVHLRVFVCVSDRGDQVQLCLVFISVTQRKLGDEGDRETRAGSGGKQWKTKTSKYMPVSPAPLEIKSKHSQTTRGWEIYALFTPLETLQTVFSFVV